MAKKATHFAPRGTLAKMAVEHAFDVGPESALASSHDRGGAPASDPPDQPPPDAGPVDDGIHTHEGGDVPASVPPDLAEEASVESEPESEPEVAVFESGTFSGVEFLDAGGLEEAMPDGYSPMAESPPKDGRGVYLLDDDGREHHALWSRTRRVVHGLPVFWEGWVHPHNRNPIDFEPAGWKEELGP